MRPRTLDEMVGQKRLLRRTARLRRAVESGRVHSMILWGRQVVETTLALLLAEYPTQNSVPSPPCSPACRRCARLAEAAQRFAEGRRTVLFVDECTASTRRSRMRSCRISSAAPSVRRCHHRESVVRVEFALSALPRMSWKAFRPPTSSRRWNVLGDRARPGRRGYRGPPELLLEIATAADGDVRRALTLLEIAAELAGGEGDASRRRP